MVLSEAHSLHYSNGQSQSYMLLIVCDIKFVTLVFPLPRSPPPSLISLSPETELNLFCCAFVCKPGIAQGGWKQLQIHTERRPGAQVVPSNNGSVYSPHTKITCANKNQFGSLRTTSRGSQLVCQKTQKKQRNGKKSEHWRIKAQISFECCYSNIVYSRAPVYIVIMHSEVWILTHVVHT